MAVGLGEGVALAASLVMGGCFGIHWPQDKNVCLDASAKITECLDLGASTGEGGGEDITCEGASLCVSQCILSADCATIQDAFGGMLTSVGQPLIDCINQCTGADQPL